MRKGLDRGIGDLPVGSDQPAFYPVTILVCVRFAEQTASCGHRLFHLSPLAELRIMLRWLLLDGYMQNEWAKPREYSFTNAAGEVFHEIAYSRQDVNIFAKMHKAANYKPTENDSVCKLLVAD